MNSEKNLRIRDQLYLSGMKRVIQSVSFLLGVPITNDVVSRLVKASYPIVVGTRKIAVNHAYRDYAAFIGKNPENKIPMNRFTPEVWQRSITEIVKDVEHVTTSVIEELGMSADYWVRDAEWGERLQLAKKDKRIGRIARVDFDPPTCPFCTLMNSRGPVYANEDSFLRTLHTGDTCSPVFVLKGETQYPGMEHTAEALARYEKAVKAVGPHQGPNAIMAEMKNQHPYDGPGKVRQAAKTASDSAREDRIREIQSNNSSLEKMKLGSGNTSLRDDQINRNNEILNALGA